MTHSANALEENDFGFAALRQAIRASGAPMAMARVRTLTSRLVSSFLYGITIVDVATYVGVIVVVGAVGMAATFVPARRILRIDPTSALRV